MNHKTDMQADLKRIASELRAYNPAADEYKGEHIHKVWAREIEAALASQSAGVPIYQVTEDDDAWHDTDWTTYDSASNDSRRIVYASAPAPVSEPSPDHEQAAYSAPFNTDVPQCCGNPETCNDPCVDHEQATLCEDGGKCGIGGYCGQCEKLRAASDPEQPKQSAPAPLSEYHEDTGPVVWWTWQDGLWLGEPAWIGAPTDSDWPGYHTHWTYHPEFPLPPLAVAAKLNDAPRRVTCSLTHEQISALYLHLLRRPRPEFGWMEAPLVAIESALMPVHGAIHDRGFNAMNRQFFGDDRFKFEERNIPPNIEPAEQPSERGEHNFESDKPIPIVTYDDGTCVMLSSWTGGAHEAGVFGEIALRFTDAHGVETVREYVARTSEQPSEHGEQDCPHGVDDGACKQCYGEATSGEQGEAKGVCQRCGGTGVVDDGEITGAGVEFENGPVKCVKDCQDCADSAPAKAEAKCKACNGNDGDMPCAYPEGRADCLRNASAPTLGEAIYQHDQGDGFWKDVPYAEWQLLGAKWRRIVYTTPASAPTLVGGDGEVAVRAKTVHRRIDALCEAANTAGADYFDASTSMLIATRDLLTALGFPHRMAAPQPQAAEPSEPSSSCDPGDICAGCRCKYNTYGKQKLDAVDVRVATIQSLMLKWINSTPGSPAKSVWTRIEEHLVALASAPQPQAAEPKGMTEEQRKSLEHAIWNFDRNRFVEDARNLRALLANGE